MVFNYVIHVPPIAANQPQDMMDTSTSDWIKDGFLDDDAAGEMSKLHQRQFLRTGVKPVVGQRVELKILMQREHAFDFHLSGQVMAIKPEPQELFPMSAKDDFEGSNVLSMHLAEFVLRPENGYPSGITFEKCPCQDSDCKDGRLFISKDRWKKTLEHDEEKKQFCEAMMKLSTLWCGAKHGQRVVCEGRLNFDHDMRRGTEDGPWADGIPLDARDIYSWEMVLNDHYENKWVLDKDSLQNLGRDRRPRCWPWTNDDQLPYDRTGVDLLDRNIDGAMFYHYCLGPFGCTGKDHKHDFAGAA